VHFLMRISKAERAFFELNTVTDRTLNKLGYSPLNTRAPFQSAFLIY